jgi:hypothetical protein
MVLDRRIFSRTVDAAVPAPVVIRAVAILFTIRFVVLVVLGDEIVHSEPVVAGNEVDALFGFAFFVAIDLRAAEQAVGDSSSGTVIAAKKAADIVTKAPVPLPPTIAYKTSHLIEASCVPRLGHHFRAGKRGSESVSQRTGAFDIGWPEESRARIRREVKTETVDMHFLYPVAEAVKDHPANNRMVCVQSVAGTAVIGVAGAVPFQHVICRVIEA